MKKIEFKKEYILDCTPLSLFRALTTAEGLKGWFAENVEIDGDLYTFYWNKVPNLARLIEKKEPTFVRFEWETSDIHQWEFLIETNEMTRSIILYVTELVSEDDYHEMENLWDKQIEKLKRSIGCSKK